ncbi:hypothetical protein EW026_g1783 [Hermanssonia centrifuga]|uniref:Uncharacterized protein n=1 Tax=Hermanssonia centrifuga TaxID=98765 RepID=A0A4V3XB66_9APHY|nr:hypothetical protein EW026_g1783 [Hermanssonia centrifuga]
MNQLRHKACNFANDHHVFAFDYLQQMYREGKTVHLIHSKVDEFNGVALKQAQTEPEPVSKRGPVTVQLVEKGGHMFVQTNPEQTARTVWNALYHIKNAYLPKEPVQRLVQTGTQEQGNTNSVQMMKARL